MTPEWEPDAEVLERRYQWLLAWYPSRHRAAHGEEMLGVLLAAAPDDQRRPRLGEAANLIWGALLIWLRPRPAAEAAGPWSDALAAFSVAAPLALLTWFAAQALTDMVAGTWGGWSAGIPIAIAYSSLGLALPFVLLGLRRTAAVVCCAATLLLAFVAGRTVGSIGGSALAIPFFLYATESIALLGSPGPRRGWRVLTWRAWVAIGAAAVAAGVFQVAVRTAWRLADERAVRRPLLHPYLGGWIAWAVVAAVTLALIAVAVWRRSALGRSVLLLFAIPAYAWLVTMIWSGPPSPAAAELVTYLPPLVLAGVVLAAVRRERREGRERRERRERRDGPDGGQAARA